MQFFFSTIFHQKKNKKLVKTSRKKHLKQEQNTSLKIKQKQQNPLE